MRLFLIAILISGCSSPGPGKSAASFPFDVIAEFQKKELPNCSEVTVGTYKGKNYSPVCSVR